MYRAVNILGENFISQELWAKLSKEKYQVNEKIEIEFYLPNTNNLYLLNVTNQTIELIFPIIGCPYTLLHPGHYSYPNIKPKFPIKNYRIGDTSELFILIYSNQDIYSFDNILKLAIENAKEKRAKKEKFTLTVKITEQILLNASEELKKNKWTFIPLLAELEK